MKIDLGNQSLPINVGNQGGNTTNVKPIPVAEKPIKVSGPEGYTEFMHKPNQEMTIDEKEWVQLIEKANKAISGGNRSFEYSIHEKTKEIIVKVIDKDTNEVIKEIPSEKMLNMVAKMWEMSGLLVDERR